MRDTLPTVLIINDEVRSLEALERNLSDDFDVRTAVSTEQAEQILNDEWVQVILCDQRMPEMTGVEFLAATREKWPEVIRIIISGHTDAKDIITGINDAGIYQYITKPWQPEKLILTLKNAFYLFELQRQNELLAIELKMTSQNAESIVGSRRKVLRDKHHGNDGIIRAEGSSMNAICDTLRQLATCDVSVLLTGESGAGKELVARGALKQALVGAPIRPGETEPVAVQHIVRSFDPCMVCTVH